ncbi:DegT/DnrJ/EryC1/StrS family aminotransferase [Candidatus Viridilinea mediisalina]|uniref:Erythromycin biosynthesis sensory transduction protein eryC1 n=1 Tax=Candidatus Viridilinea mediisalina TaxID=2024553 RepID=A0A2A6RIQ7_9CHLR|nr:DegT/DnrJ/EryC1/StrS family aminotransferase [Candidatus Viridilinea mediisalina]PDW02748.1 erythromycin biosynthesis sensory transduction protein eryC1 [Candidatus Viridilinea mediisalina]
MIPFVDLKTQYQNLKAEIDQAVLEVLARSQFVLGPAVAAFEEQFAAYCQTRYAVAVNSGTSALHLALLAAGVGPGDEVITTPHTFIATVAAIAYTGATPVFVEIEPDSFTLDPARLASAVTPRTKVLLPVHLYGQAAAMEAVMAFAQQHGLVVIEDAAQAHGAEYQGRRVGSIGALGCFSFYPGKNLGAYGEGGALTTSDPELARKLRMLRDWGAERRYHHEIQGFNYRMDGIQGAVLGVKLRYLEQWIEARRALAARYTAALTPLGIRVPTARPECRHVYHIYAIRDARRDELQSFLQQQGISTGIHYPIPVHLQGAFAALGYQAGTFPQSEAAAREVLSLPLYPELQPEQQDQVIAALAEWSGKEESVL